MNQDFKEITFKESTLNIPGFDYVTFEDILHEKPLDHNQFDFHKLNFYGILLFTENTGQYNLNFRDYTVNQGTLFTLRTGNVHKFYKNNLKGVLLIFTEDFILNYSKKGELFKTLLLFNEMLSSPRLDLNEAEYFEILSIAEIIKKEYFFNKDHFSPNIIRSLLQVILNKLIRVKEGRNTAFKQEKYFTLFLKYHQLVEDEFVKTKKVAYYAKELDITTKTLNNVTQRIINKSAKAIINDIVIFRSKMLISNTKDSLSEIAYAIGFDEPTNFFKFFKKYAGVSAKYFRESNC